MKTKGFTLFEILIAVFILGIISVVMVRGLQSIIIVKNNLERSEHRLQELSLAMTFMQSDLRNAVNRPILLANNETEPSLWTENDAFQTVAWTRGNIENPLDENRSTLLRVAYELKNGQLIRQTWPVLDRVVGTAPDDRVLLNNVEQIQWKFLGPRIQWYTAWPSSDKKQPLPVAVQVTIQIKDWGTVQRIFMISAGQTNVVK
jgi:general secretion pathway protein J